jgi:hypothetical protein
MNNTSKMKNNPKSNNKTIDRTENKPNYKNNYTNINTSKKSLTNTKIFTETTTYYANLLYRPSSDFTTGLKGILIATATTPPILSLTLLRNPKSVARTYKKQPESKLTPCGQLHRNCPGE